MSASFASLHAGLLSRKGQAAPSLEPSAQPRIRPEPGPAPIALTPMARLKPEPRIPPTPSPIHVTPAKPAQTPEPPRPARASVRLTHEQFRALRLAALLLDRPQQELMAAGVDLRLEKLACGPLESCACFREAVAKLARSQA